MAHLQIQIPGKMAAVVTRQIAARGLLHLVDIAHGRLTTTDAAPADTRELLAAFRDLVRRIRQTAARLNLILPDPSGAMATADIDVFDAERQRLEKELTPTETAVDVLWRRRIDAGEQSARAAADLRSATSLARAGVDVARLSKLRFAAVTLGVLSADDVGTLAASLTPAPFAIVPIDERDDGVLVAVAMPAAIRGRLEAALRVVSFTPVRLTNADAAVLSADAARRAVDDAETAGRAATEELAALQDQARPVLASLHARAELAVLLLQAQTNFAASGRYVVISGWIPEDQSAAMTRTVLAATDNRAVIDVTRPEEMPETLGSPLRIPILHRNPILLRPFQALIGLYGIPSYAEVPPTAFFAISFLLMFGFMFGDVGHGLVLTAAGYCLFRYMPQFLDYGLLLIECGVFSLGFGVLYGSFFGVEGLLPVLWMEPIHDLRRFMAVAVGFGVLLVSLGLVLNVINNWRSGERVSALLGPRGLFGAFLYWVVIALVARAIVPVEVVLPMPVLAGMLAVPVMLFVFRRPIVRLVERGGTPRNRHPKPPGGLAALEASIELVDAVFSYFANTISFVRVAAFAVVHAGVFVAMFAMADTLAHFRFGQPLGIAALVAGNAIMILLEGLTVSVQVLRLEYYEFFGKFFRGGGELYRPLMLRKGGG